MKNSEGSVHKKIRSIGLPPEEESILFAAVRSLYIRDITINVVDIGELVRISGDVEKQRSMTVLESLGVLWQDNYYYYKKNQIRKTLSEICQLVKTEYVEGTSINVLNNKVEPHSGMCVALGQLVEEGKLLSQDEERFMVEYRKFIKNRRVFYSYFGNKTHNSDQFAWDPKNRPARIKWLDQRI